MINLKITLNVIDRETRFDTKITAGCHKKTENSLPVSMELLWEDQSRDQLLQKAN